MRERRFVGMAVLFYVAREGGDGGGGGGVNCILNVYVTTLPL